MATSTAPASAAPSSSRSSKLLIVVLSAVTVCALAGGGYFYLATGKQADAAPAVKPPEKPIFIALEPLTVNLQSEGRGRFLHIGIALKVQDEKAKAQVVEFMPELRSRVLLLLSNRLPESLLSTEDKSKLAEEIRTTLNAPLSGDLPPQRVSSVSFNTFVVQ
ncbi:flagellar basal body-associated protein FliL [Variovorax sp. ZT4R33]|uniref:flagellar basal body-associated protein FliL n=1 Tax=Variovorax sp. ZT4R33 TaxID=3443743 RepID=UPI003F45B88F